MNDFLEKLNKAKTEIIFDADKKSQIRSNLVNFVNSNPVTPKSLVSNKIKGFLQDFFAYHKIAFSGALAALVLLLGAGTSYAAQNSLPGDLLYPVKINLNEGVKSALQFTPEQKAEYEAEKAETRLQEATKLIEQKRLTPEKKAIVEHKLDENIKVINSQISTLIEQGNNQASENISKKFENSLKVHKKILKQSQSKNNPSSKQENNLRIEQEHNIELNFEKGSDHNESKRDSEDSGRDKFEIPLRINSGSEHDED